MITSYNTEKANFNVTCETLEQVTLRKLQENLKFICMRVSNIKPFSLKIGQDSVFEILGHKTT
jgi:hypothetical protein